MSNDASSNPPSPCNTCSVKAMLLLIDCKDLLLSNPSVAFLNGHAERGLKKTDEVSDYTFFSIA